MGKTSALALECSAAVSHLEDLRQLIALEICEQPDVSHAKAKGEIHWDAQREQIVLPILISVAENARLSQVVLQAIVDLVSGIYFAESSLKYHGLVRVEQITR